MRRIELTLFAKQPLPGQVKMRLQPHYTPEQAAEIAAFMISATVELAVSGWPNDVSLQAWPDQDHALFRELAARHGIHLATQRGADLGERMHNALSDGIARHRAAAILGCDVPQCRWEILDQANDWLARGQNVLGPTEDGGYYLIGLTQAQPGLFRDIPWGGPEVLAATLARARTLGVGFELLPRLRDVDTAEDLWLVAQCYEPLKRFLK